MVNIDDFIKRLQIILDYYGLSASSFADRIDVQRSSISHLLSGRNKPSLDFILKVIEVFPDVDLYWILNGKGNFPKSERKIEAPKVTPILENNKIEEKNDDGLKSDLFSSIHDTEKNNVFENIIEQSSSIPNLNTDQNEVDYIVVFFTNGTFKKYKEKK